MDKAYLGGGCFWCTEAIYQKLKGVESVTPGYSGGTKEKPTYEEVSTGTTGHTESIEIIFDPKIISYEDILYVFFKTHNPTTLNRQGADVGTQYHSAIFYTNYNQKQIAINVIMKIQNEFKDKIVTEVAKFHTFYPAEDYHKNYYENHKNAFYCKLVIDPKIKKLQENFAGMIK